MQPKRPVTAAPSRRRANKQLSRSQIGGSKANNSVAYPRAFNTMDPFPVSLRKQLTYCQITSLSSGNGLLGTQQAFRLNSVYDPDYTGAGHQPYGFDQMSPLYNNYRVDKVKFELVFTTPGGGSDMLCVATVAPNTSSGLTGGALYTVQERPDGIWGVCSSSGDRRCVLRGDFDLHTVCGVPKSKYISEDNFSAAVTTNPNQVALLSVNAGCVDGTNAESIQCMLVITYDVVFFNRVTQATS